MTSSTDGALTPTSGPTLRRQDAPDRGTCDGSSSDRSTSDRSTSGGALRAVPEVTRTERGWHACVDLPLDPRAAAAARRTARQVLQAWGVQEDDLLHDVAIVVSELVGNGVRHGGHRVELELLLDAATVEVAVIDGSAVLPQPRGFEDDAEGGRGIAIVDAISREWGVQERPEGGKRVFARLPR